jgi:hypothetical protein
MRVSGFTAFSIELFDIQVLNNAQNTAHFLPLSSKRFPSKQISFVIGTFRLSGVTQEPARRQFFMVKKIVDYALSTP